MADPARTPKRTKAEMLKLYQEGCRAAPCRPVETGRLVCPFCPWLKKFYLKEGTK